MSPRTLINDENVQDQAFVGERELNDFFEAVVVTGTETATEVVQTFPQYFVEQNLIVGTSGSITVSSGINPVTISGAMVVVEGIGYISDLTRGGKYLSLSRQNYAYSRSGARDNGYLDVQQIAQVDAGWVIPRKGTIVAITSFWISGVNGKSLEIHRNNSATVLHSHVGDAGVPNYENTLNVDLNAGDKLRVFVSAAGGSITNTNVIVEVAWRL